MAITALVTTLLCPLLTLSRCLPGSPCLLAISLLWNRCSKPPDVRLVKIKFLTLTISGVTWDCALEKCLVSTRYPGTCACPNDCLSFSAQGICRNETCECSAGWAGRSCSFVKCPSTCSNAGILSPHNSFINLCSQELVSQGLQVFLIIVPVTQGELVTSVM